MISFKQFLIEKGGADAGVCEVHATSLKAARTYAKQELAKFDLDLDTLLPNFDQNYMMAKAKIEKGHTQRKDMPVIARNDVWLLQRRLLRGSLDINKPYSKDTDPNNPFPEGLKGDAAKKFLTNGFRDGQLKDDIIKFELVKKSTKTLKPIQQQIYLSESINMIAKKKIEGIKSMVTNSYSLSSQDDYILDGHHRWFACMLINPSIDISMLEIELPLSKLLKLLLAYGDAIGNARNQ